MKGNHYVWCSEDFDSKARDRYTPSHHMAPSSNPIEIYKDLKAATLSGDRHNSKIADQKVNLTALAVKFSDNGSITDAQKDEIIYIINAATFDDWRPLIYLIPRDNVETRLKLVDAAERASPLCNEYIICDLQKTEFDVIEV